MVIPLAISVARIFVFHDSFRSSNKNGQQHQQCSLEYFNVFMNGTLHGGHYAIENRCVFLVKQMMQASKS